VRVAVRGFVRIAMATTLGAGARSRRSTLKRIAPESFPSRESSSSRAFF
jgi:hypothetical protein